MEDRIWFEIPAKTPYDELPDIIEVNESNFIKYSDRIQESVDLFYKHVFWDEMWDVDQAIARLSKNEKFYIYTPNGEVKAYVWLRGNYIYNFFVAPEVIKYNISERFIKHIFNLNSFTAYFAYTEGWNKKVENYVIKRLGGSRI